MQHKINMIFKMIMLCLLMGTCSHLWAVCYLVNYLNGTTLEGTNSATTDPSNAAAAKINAGDLRLYNDAVQPIGTKLSEVNVPATNYIAKNATAETILWRCDNAADLSNAKFLVATNGKDSAGGRDLVAATDAGNQSNIFYTGLKNIGIRQTLGNMVLTRVWKGIAVTAYDVGTYTGTINAPTQCPNGSYCIRLKHIPNLKVELFKVNDPRSTISSTCGAPITTGNYSCNQPAAYIQLADTIANKGNNSSENAVRKLDHDVENEDTLNNTVFSTGFNGLAYSLYNATYLTPANNYCVATTANTQTVNFPTISTNLLNSGSEVAQNFQIYVECSGNVTAGTGANQFAVGIQASPAAFNQAQSLGLVNASQGVSALVSDDYASNAARAKNVGIYLYKDGGATAMNFVGQPGQTGSGFPSGNSAGWYNFPVLTQSSGTNTRTIPLRAVLKKLPTANPATAGTVHATAYVLVKIQ